MAHVGLELVLDDQHLAAVVYGDRVLQQAAACSVEGGVAVRRRLEFEESDLRGIHIEEVAEVDVADHTVLQKRFTLVQRIVEFLEGEGLLPSEIVVSKPVLDPDRARLFGGRAARFGPCLEGGRLVAVHGRISSVCR